MSADEFTVDIPRIDGVFVQTLRNMVQCVNALHRRLPRPQLVHVAPSIPMLRYVEQEPVQAVVMKLARIVSALMAARTLVHCGLCQDAGAMQRIVDELNDDVCFLCFAIIDGNFTPNHKRFLDEFWQEEFEDIGKPTMRNTLRNRVSRGDIQGYLSQHAVPAGMDHSKVVHATKLVAKSYSGYVHGAGYHIMEMYGGDPGEFHFDLRGTPNSYSQFEDLVNNHHRSIGSFFIAAKAFGDPELVEQVRAFRTFFEEHLALDYFDEMNARLAARKKPDRSGGGSKASEEL
jgi:hypothetical protein